MLKKVWKFQHKPYIYIINYLIIKYKTMKTEEYYRLQNENGYDFYDTEEEALSDVPKTYKKVDIDTFSKWFAKDKGMGLRYTSKNIQLSWFKKEVDDEDDNIIDEKEWVLVSRRTYSHYTNG